MRPFITILLVCFLMGGMYTYLKFADSVKRPQTNHQITDEEKVVTVEILRSATLYADAGFEVVALKIDFRDETVLQENSNVPADQPISISLPAVESGLNTVNVLANFEDPESFLSDAQAPSLYAIEVVIRIDGNVLQRQTFSGLNSTNPIGGQVSFDTTAATR